MLRKIDHESMGHGDQGWLKSIFHFSFANYYNPQNMNFGVLRVLNDDLIAGQTGFDLHPHKDMEIISYVIEGQVTHGDTMGNENTITRGHVQYMSAGTGVYHSEFNLGDSTGRFLQLWILPDKKGHTPQYGDVRFDWDLRTNQWLKIVSGQQGEGPIKIHQDVNVYVTDILASNSLELEVGPGRQAYLIQIEGASDINGVTLNERDALEIIEETIKIQTHHEHAHIMVIEMPQE